MTLGAYQLSPPPPKPSAALDTFASTESRTQTATICRYLLYLPLASASTPSSCPSCHLPAYNIPSSSPHRKCLPILLHNTNCSVVCIHSRHPNLHLGHHASVTSLCLVCFPSIRRDRPPSNRCPLPRPPPGIRELTNLHFYHSTNTILSDCLTYFLARF